MAKLWYGFLYAYKRISFKITDIRGGLIKVWIQQQLW